MEDLDFVRVYPDDLLVISKDNFEDHLEKIDRILGKLMETGLRINLKSCTLAQAETEYLGYIVSREGTKPQPKKIGAILNLKETSNLKQLKGLLDMMQYYKDI